MRAGCEGNGLASRVKRVAMVAAACVVALSVQASAGYPMTVKDARGKNVVVSAKPKRIVSLAPNITEILFALGAGDRVVGVTTFCNYPPAATKKAKVGDMRAGAERVIALRPDLVIGHAVVNDTLITRLEGLHKTVFAVDPKTLAQVESDIKTIGKVIGSAKAGDAVVSKMQAGIASARRLRAGKKAKSVLVVIQPNPLWAAGPKTFVDEMLKIANAKNVAYDARAGFVPFSRELAISRNPDVIIVGSKADRDFFLKSPAWKNTRAAKSGHVEVISPDLLVRPGPRLVDGLRAIAGVLNRG